MAKNTAVRLLDDLDGRTASQTVRFSLDGVRYEIDLSDRNAKKLRTILQRYIENGRREGRKPVRRVVLQQNLASTTSAKSSRNARTSAASASTKTATPRKPAQKTSTKGNAGKARARVSATKTVQPARATKTKSTKKS